MEQTFIRVGNDCYAEENGSYGLTTLKDRHAKINGHVVEFRFKGKGGKPYRHAVEDRKLAQIVKRCRDIPGQRLFQYLDEHGQNRPVTSSDVNDYLKETMGFPFTAKSFRTWAGTVGATLLLQRLSAASDGDSGAQNGGDSDRRGRGPAGEHGGDLSQVLRAPRRGRGVHGRHAAPRVCGLSQRGATQAAKRAARRGSGGARVAYAAGARAVTQRGSGAVGAGAPGAEGERGDAEGRVTDTAHSGQAARRHARKRSATRSSARGTGRGGR